MSNEKYENNVKNRKCTQCWKPLPEGYTKKTCEDCLKRINQGIKERRSMRKMLGLCPLCGKKLYGDEKKCVECRAYCANIAKKYRENNREEINKKLRDYYHKTRQIRLDQNLCVRCGKKAQEGKKHCTACLVKLRERNNSGKILRSEWVSHGMCYRCGGKIIPGMRLCERCWEQNVENSNCENAVNARKNNTSWR